MFGKESAGITVDIGSAQVYSSGSHVKTKPGKLCPETLGVGSRSSWLRSLAKQMSSLIVRCYLKNTVATRGGSEVPTTKPDRWRPIPGNYTVERWK